MPRDYKIYLEDIIECIAKIHNFTAWDIIENKLSPLEEQVKGILRD
jgi:uncharacterized protein with HEPN domain